MSLEEIKYNLKEEEEFIPIVVDDIDYSGYQVSNLGTVVHNGHIVDSFEHNGYKHCSLNDGEEISHIPVHRLVASFH